MNFLKSVFGFLWFVWGGIVFMTVVTPLTLIYFVVLTIFGKKYSMACVWINCRYASPLILKLIGVKLNIHHAEKIDPKRTYVFVSNHCSQLDIISNAAAVPVPMRFLAKAEVKYIPFFGYMVKMLAIMVDRKSKESREKSLNYMADAIAKGESLFIYPEGTRNRTEEPLKEFKDGAFRTAIMAQAPIAVQTLVNSRNLNDPRKWQLFPGTIDLYWSDVIETKGLTQDDVPMLKEKVKHAMLQYLLKAQ